MAGSRNVKFRSNVFMVPVIKAFHRLPFNNYCHTSDSALRATVPPTDVNEMTEAEMADIATVEQSVVAKRKHNSNNLPGRSVRNCFYPKPAQLATGISTKV
jgi:hypothetical protein